MAPTVHPGPLSSTSPHKLGVAFLWRPWFSSSGEIWKTEVSGTPYSPCHCGVSAGSRPSPFLLRTLSSHIGKLLWLAWRVSRTFIPELSVSGGAQWATASQPPSGRLRSPQCVAGAEALGSWSNPHTSSLACE